MRVLIVIISCLLWLWFLGCTTTWRFGKVLLVEGHIYTGDLLRSGKRYDEAFSHWKRALEMEPEWCDAAYSMASCYEELGRYGKAYEAYMQIADNLESRGCPWQNEPGTS